MIAPASARWSRGIIPLVVVSGPRPERPERDSEDEMDVAQPQEAKAEGQLDPRDDVVLQRCTKEGHSARRFP
ncbi:hypothetical protein SAMN05444166_0610 [Singulisphaera sp. GP187]|nr:hypothetical protein SAMN05444166_0610 [Singulisphaera sp. GP187]